MELPNYSLCKDNIIILLTTTCPKNGRSCYGYVNYEQFIGQTNPFELHICNIGTYLVYFSKYIPKGCIYIPINVGKDVLVVPNNYIL